MEYFNTTKDWTAVDSTKSYMGKNVWEYLLQTFLSGETNVRREL